MARKVINGHEYEIPDGMTTGDQLSRLSNLDYKVVPVVHRDGKDIAITPSQQIHLGPDDVVTYISPFQTGAWN